MSEVGGLWGAGCVVGGGVGLHINLPLQGSGWVESSMWHQASSDQEYRVCLFVCLF